MGSNDRVGRNLLSKVTGVHLLRFGKRDEELPALLTSIEKNLDIFVFWNDL